MTTVIVLISLAVNSLLGAIDPNGFTVRFLAILADIVAFIAAVAQMLDRTLRDPWDHS